MDHCQYQIPLPCELLLQIGLIDIQTYVAMLAIPIFARTITCGYRLTAMEKFGVKCHVTQNGIAWNRMSGNIPYVNGRVRQFRKIPSYIGIIRIKIIHQYWGPSIIIWISNGLSIRYNYGTDEMCWYDIALNDTTRIISMSNTGSRHFRLVSGESVVQISGGYRVYEAL